MFISALASVSGADGNRLRLPKVKYSVVILVDGLGFENLKMASGYSRFLNQKLDVAIRCEFPSTTATSIAGFSTGVRSNEHGLIGYSAYDRVNKFQMGLLTGWETQGSAEKFKKVSTLAELSDPVKVFAIGPKAYESTGFTVLTMAGATYARAERLSERFETVEKMVRSEDQSLSYLYIPELDQIAHRHGVASNEWLFALEELDQLVNRFISKLSSDVGVLVTADHGVVDVPKENHIYLDEFDWYTAAVESTAGDPRCNFVYLTEPNKVAELRELLEREFGSVAYICNVEELSIAGWLGQFSAEGSNLLPDLYIIWRDLRVGYDRRFAKPSHIKLIGQHGGISDVETRIPLIKLGRY